jgi:hypothetical protein
MPQERTRLWYLKNLDPSSGGAVSGEAGRHNPAL